MPADIHAGRRLGNGCSTAAPFLNRVHFYFKKNNMQAFSITIDGSSLFNNRILLIDPSGNTVTGDWLDCSKPLHLELVPGEYHFSSQATISDFSFTVTGNGELNISPATEAFMKVVNGNTLKLTGYRVKVDARYLTGNGISWPTAHVPAANDGLLCGFMKNETISLLPGMAYYLQSASGMVSNFYVKVTVTGQWQVLNPKTMAPDAVYDGFITLINDAYVPELIIFGYPVLIDGRSAKHTVQLIDVMATSAKGGNHSPFDDEGVLLVNLMPQRQETEGFGADDLYRFITDKGAYSHPGFYITNAGKIAFDPLYSLYFTVDRFNGMQRLTVLYPLPELIP
jgi:hypothetical protein